MFWLASFGISAFIYTVICSDREWYYIMYGLVPGAFLLALSLCTRESIGYGDGWTISALGLLVGAKECVLIVFAGFIFSAVFSLIMLMLHRVNGKSRLPFLPFVTIGMGAAGIAQNIR